ncbi:uncharacterized protein PV06_05984 [Exophiala oligosperma]|uniref:Dynamin-binding protein n=1 Tax=Exophiala oligosperma TaxID=215243 RepID=A0A0D2BY76_9EURO|nr:uncharacterized protein PV06_05984 [Exophiala oligosperma]KIW42432.1 hypothetical protein PV06_05984 [Exophiala oligosperma]
MPSAVPDQNNYYTTHHRRQSSHSQTNLPTQIRASPTQAPSPDPSLAFLPSTTYAQQQPSPHVARTPSGPTPSKSNIRLESVPSDEVAIDPHAFYRQYQDPFTNASPQALHQEAIRTTVFEDEDEKNAATRKSSFASAQSNEDRFQRPSRNSTAGRRPTVNTQNLPGGSWENSPARTLLKSRKASFKDLVARFDASPEEVPPLPTQFITRPASRTASPMPYSTIDPSNSYGSTVPQSKRSEPRLSESMRRMSPSYGIRPPTAIPRGRNRGASLASASTPAADPVQSAGPGRKLLFGEVIPSTSKLPAAGYGIHNARRRRGSEGSPMHSPNPMFPSSTADPQRSLHSATGQDPAQAYSVVDRTIPSANAAGTGSNHRRAQSDLPGPSSKSGRDANSPVMRRERMDSSPQGNAQSRIPISVRHNRNLSEPTSISPTTGSSSQLPLRMNGHRQSPASLTPYTDRKPPSPRRGPRSQIQIKSPGPKSGGGTSEKSPSLRANIIAPPPKISPPLRSSRPRLPVSSATTAASRAKMAEKFQTMAKQQSDSKAYRRQRPPELTDIDLKARRLKITQALTRSKEGQDLNGGLVSLRTTSTSTSRNNSIALSDDSDKPEASTPANIEIPAVVVDEPAPIQDAPEEHAFYTQDRRVVDDRRAFTQNALQIVDGGTPQTLDEVDSPTLGHTGSAFTSIPYSLDTHLQSGNDDQDPRSAVTQGTANTEATMIDAEPQADEPELQPTQSLLDQISILRSYGSRSPLSPDSHASGDNSDHADGVSVNLMLRETTYLDDDEAAEKGYRPLLPPSEPLPMPPTFHRSSWTSSLTTDHRNSDTDEVGIDKNATHHSDKGAVEAGSDSFSDVDQSSVEGSTGEAYATDAYTIVNIVLQQRTPSGVVDQQLVDDIYHRIIQASPDLVDAESVDEAKVRALCLQELDDHSLHWDQQVTPPPPAEEAQHEASLSAEPDLNNGKSGTQTITASPPTTGVAAPNPPQSYRSHHRYKSSLDSAEDWADTSPSVTDWIQFALKSPKDGQHRQQQQSLLANETFRTDGAKTQEGLDQRQAPNEPSRSEFMEIVTGRDIPRPPSHSPPPPPAAFMPSIAQTSWSAPVGVAAPSMPAAPPSRPLTAVSQMSARSSIDQQGMSTESPATRPSTDDQTPEQRRLNKRRYVLKELVDTEYTYERDMRVLCDIYKQTAVAAISEEDIKIIFGNVDIVQQFSKDFLGLLKQVVKPAYVMEKVDRRKDGNRSSTVQSSAASMDGVIDMSDGDKDELTRVGQAFEASMGDMEKVYTEYIRTRHAANKRLEVLQSDSAAREWLKECKENSTDITNAWSLDALLVKPIQRITKYPLLLMQLVDTTPDNHPDASFLRRALVEVTEINIRINEVKKHTELVDQVLNRKRKDSDVRNGLTKAFGRRAEKLRQNMGINEMFEDEEYAKLKIKYDNNIAHLFLVSKDCQGYIEAITKWVTRMCELAAAAEAWVDVGHTHYPEAESKLRQFAIVVRGINSIALPDHIDQVNRRVISPMEKTATMLERFQTDPKGLVAKRDKRLLDYNQFKNKKDRGEKIDKKMTERMEQWEALNLEAKERKKRLLKSTADLVLSCQQNLLGLHLNWLAMCKQKFSAAMEISLDKVKPEEIVKDWQEDFEYHEEQILMLSICNGSLLAEAGNLLSFLTPGTTLLGDDSPRQPSWNSGHKGRSISINDDTLTFSSSQRQSEGLMSSHSNDQSEPSSFSFVNGRIRATSAASGRLPKTPETGSRGAPSVHTVHSTSASRPGTSPGLPEVPAPRLSLDVASPSIGPLLSDSPQANRHMSSSTFYSAAPEPNQSQTQLAPSGGNIFSSAMPMDDNNRPQEEDGTTGPTREPGVLFTAASVYEFNIDRSRQQGGFRYLTYMPGEIFDVIAENGELWLAINQDDESREIGWIWNKHFAKLAE